MTKTSTSRKLVLTGLLAGAGFSACGGSGSAAQADGSYIPTTTSVPTPPNASLYKAVCQEAKQVQDDVALKTVVPMDSGTDGVTPATHAQVIALSGDVSTLDNHNVRRDFDNFVYATTQTAAYNAVAALAREACFPS